ncbi:MAG: hypothetical protein MK193_07055 [Lentisphaeria bacterium]|nr:hypothetical protein [Lentisphaeria bacterium]
MRNYIYLVFFMALQVSYGQVVKSIQSGIWEDPQIWSTGEVPNERSEIIVEHEVLITQNLHIRKKLSLQKNAQIILDNSKNEVVLFIHNGGLLVSKGSPQNFIAIEATSNKFPGFISDNSENGGGIIQANHTKFINLRDHENYQAWYFRPSGSSAHLVIEDCIFEKCGRISPRYTIAAGGVARFIRSVFRDSQVKPKEMRKKYEEWYTFTTGSMPGAECEVTYCDFDKTVYLLRPNGYRVENNIFRDGVHGYVHLSGDWTSFAYNMIRWKTPKEDDFGFRYGNKIEHCMFIKDYEYWNPHFIIVGKGKGVAEVSGCIWWYKGLSSGKHVEGDGIIIGASEGTQYSDAQLKITQNIFLPNGDGSANKNGLTCTGVTALGDKKNAQIVFTHNTVYAEGMGGINLGETNVSHKGLVKEISHNIFWASKESLGSKIRNLGHSEAGIIDSSNVFKNVGYMVKTSTPTLKSQGYLKFEYLNNDYPGKGDLDGINPNFKDSSRNVQSWSKSIGGPGTIEHAMNSLKPIGKHNFQDLLNHIRDGFQPQEKKLKVYGASNK